MKTKYYKQIIISCLLTGNTMLALAQQDSTKLHKEVEVVKAYQPTIIDAYKINDMPQIEAPTTNKPIFDYRIKTRPMISEISLEPVQAARMTAEPNEHMNNGLLKLGLGNYWSQYGEFFYNAKISHSSIGVHLKSDLSNGKLKLKNNDKVKAPDNENLAELFTSHHLHSGTLTTKLYYERKSFRYYGYTGDYLTDEKKSLDLPMWNEKQAFSKVGFSIKYDKKQVPKTVMDVNTGLNYQYFGTRTGQMEHKVDLNSHFSVPIDLVDGVLDAGVSYSTTDSVYSEYSHAIDKRNQLIVKVNPAAVFDTEILKFKIGINSYTVFDRDEKTTYMLAPNTRIEYMPVKNVLSFYAGTNGYLTQNDYSTIAGENPFTRPDQNIKNTKYRYILTGGIKGKFIPNFSYGLQADYANIKNQHFYYLRSQEVTNNGIVSQQSDNTFDVLYDKAKEFTFGGELQYAINQEVNIRLQAKYHAFTLDSLQEAFLKPAFESSVSFYFDPEGPVRFTADIYCIGQRKALVRTNYSNLDDLTGELTNSISATDEISTMDAIVDLNLGIEYQFTGKLSFWGRANNFSFKKYELFPGYSQQGFNVLVGGSFSF